MRLNIYGLSFRLTDAITEHVRRRVDTVLASLDEGSVTDVAVRLWDINGTRGGDDKACRIVVSLRRRGSVIADAVDHDLYAAIDAAADKVKARLSRQTKRARTLRREYASRHLPGRLLLMT